MIERLLEGVLKKWISKSRKYGLFFFFFPPSSFKFGWKFEEAIGDALNFGYPKGQEPCTLVALIGSPMKENSDLNQSY